MGTKEKKLTIGSAKTLLESHLAMSGHIDFFVVERMVVSSLELLSPMPKLSRMSFGEFIAADICFLQYAGNKNSASLDRLIAILFRPRKWQRKKNIIDDKRRKFDDREVTARAKYISRIAHEYKELVYLNYAAIRQWLGELYPNIFQSSTGKKAKGGTGSWLKIRDELTTGLEFEKTDNALMHDVLRKMNHQLEGK